MASDSSTQRAVSDSLKARGWAFLDRSALASVPNLEQRLPELDREIRENLPPDPYCSRGTRYRRHGSRRFHSRTGELRPGRVTVYQQPASLNPDERGAVRRFAGLDGALAPESLLHDLIRADFSMLPDEPDFRDSWLDVGIHMIAYRPTNECEAVGTPNKLHRDGEPYTFIHLVCRQDVSGGESVIAADESSPVTEVMLRKPMDTLAIDDRTVLHGVRPTTQAHADSHGCRGVLLIDFTAAALNEI